VEAIQAALGAVNGVTEVTVNAGQAFVVLNLTHHVMLGELNTALSAAGPWSLSGEAMLGGPAQSGGFKDYIPLLIMFAIIAAGVAFFQSRLGEFDGAVAMRHAMAGFFLLFGGLKFLNLRGFVGLFASYDLLASRTLLYAWFYPFLEVGLGISHAFAFIPFATNFVTLVVMVFGAVGVIRALKRNQDIRCACLGSWVTIPLSWVTVAEDVAMAAMATAMLL
jgi:hypothetical protein